MDLESRRLLSGVVLYVVTIGGAVATLGAAFAGNQEAPEVAYAAPSGSKLVPPALSGSR
jgi:hypothetical protein